MIDVDIPRMLSYEIAERDIEAVRLDAIDAYEHARKKTMNPELKAELADMSRTFIERAAPVALPASEYRVKCAFVSGICRQVMDEEITLQRAVKRLESTIRVAELALKMNGDRIRGLSIDKETLFDIYYGNNEHDNSFEHTRTFYHEIDMLPAFFEYVALKDPMVWTGQNIARDLKLVEDRADCLLQDLKFDMRGRVLYQQ